MTNFDWIKEISIEEMAELLTAESNCERCLEYYNGYDNCNGNCEEGTLNWLKEEREEELKKCPICGGKGQVVMDKSTMGYYVECSACKLRDRNEKSRVFAIHSWNEWCNQIHTIFIIDKAVREFVDFIEEHAKYGIEQKSLKSFQIEFRNKYEANPSNPKLCSSRKDRLPGIVTIRKILEEYNWTIELDRKVKVYKFKRI